MTDSGATHIKRTKLGYLGFIFGGLVSVPFAVAVYYAAKYLHRDAPLEGTIIFYILIFIGFTALFYFIKLRRIRREGRNRAMEQ